MKIMFIKQFLWNFKLNKKMYNDSGDEKDGWYIKFKTIT